MQHHFHPLHAMDQYIVGIGEVLWDCFDDHRTLGGAPFNFSFHIHQFGFRSLAISAIGDAPLGREIEQVCHLKGLDYLFPRLPYPTGEVRVQMDDKGVPSYTICEDRAWDHIPFLPSMQTIAQQTQAVCFGSLAQRNADSRASIYAFLDAMPTDALRIFDINLRLDYYSREIINSSLQRANVLKLNNDELHILQQMYHFADMSKEDACRHLLQTYNLRYLILTCGEDGSYVFTRDAMSFLPTPKVEVVDTVGAGDSFTAAFIASILRDKALEEAHRIAVDVSAYVCTQAGATPTLPSYLLN